MVHSKRCCICGTRIPPNENSFLIPCNKPYEDCYINETKYGNNIVWEMHDRPECIGEWLLMEIEKDILDGYGLDGEDFFQL